ncbi:MAG TPA: M48 family metalloprotease, partial [Caulobacteraceae bacterium]|nr:M48 family metalloprotease [Caulobacteraceae bacterium]
MVARTKARSFARTAIALAAIGGLMTPTATVHAQDDGMSLIRDTEVEEIIREEATPIFKAAGIVPENVQIHLIQTKEINAQVAGGQQLWLFTGLIVKTKNPNELMGVIAHEAGHMAGGHLARSDEGMRGAAATYLATMGLGILAALSGHGDAAAGLMYSSGYFAALNVAGYTRTQEASADQAAAKYLEAAGYSGKGLVDFLDEGKYEEVFANAKRDKYYQNHPISSQRVEALEGVVRTKSNYNKVDTPEMMAKHAVMIAKLKGFTDYPQQVLVAYPETDTSFPARYARAIAAYRELKTDDALKQIDGLIADQPTNPYLYELKGQVLYEAGRIKESEAPHRKSVELKPDAPLLQINLGQTLVAEEDNAKLDDAIDHLKKALAKADDEPMAWRLLSQCYDRKGEAGLARLAAAEQNFALGQLPAARDFAGRARQLLTKDTPQ